MKTETTVRKQDIEARLHSAKVDCDRLKTIMRGNGHTSNEHHAYYMPLHTAIQIAEQRIDALMMVLAEAR